ncbi:MAG: OmpA family protein [Saprospiraceae bacterium]
MNWLKVIFFLQILLFSSQLVAQNKQLDKANKRYQIKKYAEAIPLYEEGLEKNPSLSAKVRLAYCYRVNNNIEQAVNLYTEIVQHKRAKPITWYYYGETLMSQGKYEEAKVWLTKYTEKKPGDQKGWTLIESIDKVQTIEPYYIVKNIEPFAHNTEADDSAPVFFRDGIAFSSDRKTGAKIMKKKSSFTGRDFLSIYLSKGNDDGTFKSPKPISKRINDLNKNTGTIALSPDETLVVFSRNSDVSNRRNQYNLMLYQADITKDGRFKNVKLMEFCNNNSNHMHPTFSPDGKTLFFTSDKSGVGGTDIFYSTLGEKGWSRARNLDEPINTTANEGFPFMSSDGKLFFCSKGHTSYGGFDIFVSQQDVKGNWSQPTNIGLPINSPADEVSIYLSKDLSKGMFASSREGGDDDIYFFDIDGLYNKSSNNMLTEKPVSEEVFVSKSEDETIVVEPISESSTNTSSDDLEIPIESLQESNQISENNSIENVNEKIATVSTENVDSLMKSFDSKIETENDSSNISQKENITEITHNTSSPSEKTDLPFEPIEPFESESEPENYEDKFSKNENLSNVTEENSPSIFQEGLANIDSPMTDSTPLEIENKSKDGDVNIAEMREYLTLQSPQEEMIFILEKVKFEPKKYTITDDISSRLEQLVRLMNEFPDLKIEINAHTTSLGDDRENMVFSIKRATATAGYLIRRGIGTDRVKVMGYGETKLLNHCGNDVDCSPEDHAINQRVELKILNQ